MHVADVASEECMANHAGCRSLLPLKPHSTPLSFNAHGCWFWWKALRYRKIRVTKAKRFNNGKAAASIHVGES
jgi:hypothetical protein